MRNLNRLVEGLTIATLLQRIDSGRAAWNPDYLEVLRSCFQKAAHKCEELGRRVRHRREFGEDDPSSLPANWKPVEIDDSDEDDPTVAKARTRAWEKQTD